MTIRLPIALAAALAAASNAACDIRVNDKGVSLDISEGGRAEDEWSRSYTLPKGGRLEIVSAGGPINVTHGDGQTVQVHIIRESRESSDEAAKRALNDETITEEVTPDRVKVQTTRTRTDNAGPFGGRRISTEFRVSIPAGLNVALKAENADVSLENVQGQFTLENTNGGFRARKLSGSVRATTVNGIIDFELEQVAGDITATTVNGPVRISLLSNVNAALEARTVNGVVILDSDLPFTSVERERTRLSGRFGKGGPMITLNTTNGPISVDEFVSSADAANTNSSGATGRGRRRGERTAAARQRDGR
jgi:DUF4097 and DUF4098 domain-containing protein YvlB